MTFHPAEVLEVHSPKDREIKSSDDCTLATVRTWDENVFIFLVDEKIAKEIKIGDKVLIDYRPVSEKIIMPKQIIVKIVRGKKAEKMWEEYKKYYSSRKPLPQTQTVQPPQRYIG